MGNTPPSVDSTLTAHVVYKISDTYGDAPLVPAKLIEGIRGNRSGYSFTVLPLNHCGSHLEAVEDVPNVMLWKLEITCQRKAPFSDLEPDEAVEITVEIARDIKTAIVLRVPKWGFPGEVPPREEMKVTIDGAEAKLDHLRHYDRNSVRLFPAKDNEVTLDELRAAASGKNSPSRARMMVTEAGFQAFWNSSASDVTAVVVAASACEVAIHACIRRLADEQIQPLLNKVLPKDEQARLSPVALLDGAIPVLANRRLCDEHPKIWGSIKKLFRARDKAVHQGHLPDGDNAANLVQNARVFVRWIEELE